MKNQNFSESRFVFFQGSPEDHETPANKSRDLGLGQNNILPDTKETNRKNLTDAVDTVRSFLGNEILTNKLIDLGIIEKLVLKEWIDDLAKTAKEIIENDDPEDLKRLSSDFLIQVKGILTTIIAGIKSKNIPDPLGILDQATSIVANLKVEDVEPALSILKLFIDHLPTPQDHIH